MVMINNSSTILENHTHSKTKQNELYFNAKCDCLDGTELFEKLLSQD